MILKTFVCFLLFIIFVNGSIPVEVGLDIKPAFDWDLYWNVLDPEICREQLEHISQNLRLRLTFLEAGMRIPKGLLQLNNRDLGNYDQCLGIRQNIETSVIEGKYCMVTGPVFQTLKIARNVDWPNLESMWFDEDVFNTYTGMINGTKSKLTSVSNRSSWSRTLPDGLWDPEFGLEMAVCIPKTCTIDEGLKGLLPFQSLPIPINIDFSEVFQEQFCRLKDDKPWRAADYVAISIFSLIGFLTILSTCYDLFYSFVKKNETGNELCKSFSVYTNGKRLTTYRSSPSILSCVDGIRAISTFWVVVGHTYPNMPSQINQLVYYVKWKESLQSIWITAAPYSVDTFFLLSGTLLVYTTVGKLSGRNLLKRLHLFYLNRVLRMFPLLACAVLLNASIWFRIADGPQWSRMAFDAEACRTYWWTTLLYIQNYIEPSNMCIEQSWYLAIDMQCYTVAPIFLYWALNGKKKQGLIALSAGLGVSLAVCATYSFIKQFPGWMFAMIREGGEENYHELYYINTLTRSPPFFVGLLFGYILSMCKGKKIEIPYPAVALFWIASGFSIMGLMYITHLMSDWDWDYWVIDDLHNSFARSIWAVVVCWIIFACHHGYGGPVNWFLCLNMWKLPSRISYGIYLFHFQIQLLIQGHARTLIFMTTFAPFYHFLAHALISFGVSFALTLCVESPCTILINRLLGAGPKKQKKEIQDKKEDGTNNGSIDALNEVTTNTKEVDLKPIEDEGERQHEASKI